MGIVKKNAERELLGHHGIVGVAVGQDGRGRYLAVFLERKSKTAEGVVATWARNSGVRAKTRVTGRIVAAI